MQLFVLLPLPVLLLSSSSLWNRGPLSPRWQTPNRTIIIVSQHVVGTSLPLLRLLPVPFFRPLHQFRDDAFSLCFPFRSVHAGVVEEFVTGNAENATILELLGEWDDVVVAEFGVANFFQLILFACTHIASRYHHLLDFGGKLGPIDDDDADLVLIGIVGPIGCVAFSSCELDSFCELGLIVVDEPFCLDDDGTVEGGIIGPIVTAVTFSDADAVVVAAAFVGGGNAGPIFAADGDGPTPRRCFFAIDRESSFVSCSSCFRFLEDEASNSSNISMNAGIGCTSGRRRLIICNASCNVISTFCMR